MNRSIACQSLTGFVLFVFSNLPKNINTTKPTSDRPKPKAEAEMWFPSLENQTVIPLYSLQLRDDSFFSSVSLGHRVKKKNKKKATSEWFLCLFFGLIISLVFKSIFPKCFSLFRLWSFSVLNGLINISHCTSLCSGLSKLLQLLSLLSRSCWSSFSVFLKQHKGSFQRGSNPLHQATVPILCPCVSS